MTASTSDLIKSTMDKMAYQTVDGIKYLAFSFCETKSVAKQHEVVKNLEIKEDDVLSVGFPRSGNHWAFEVVNMVLLENPKLMESYFHGNQLDNMGDSAADVIEKIPSPRYLPTHYRAHNLPIQAVEKNVPIIYLIRNPKDTLVSLYKFMHSFKDEDTRFPGTWDQFFELQMAGEFLWGFWFDHVLDMETFMKEHPNQPVHIHCYEKMRTEPVAAIKELCSFLGKPDSLAEQIAEVSEFKIMKKALDDGKFTSPIAPQPFSGSNADTVLRKGEIGSWKDVFTVSQSERFNEAFNEKMAGSKLADYVRNYL